MPVVRWVDGPPSVADQIRTLAAGPTRAERAADLRSALDGTITGARVEVARGRAVVDLGPDRTLPGRRDEVLAYGQVVLTLTARPDVREVSFSAAGRPLDVPRADGSVSRMPLTAADFAGLIATP